MVKRRSLLLALLLTLLCLPTLAWSQDITSNLTMHLPFDEASGTTAQDSTAGNHDGILSAGASFGAPHRGAHAVVLNGTTTGLVTVAGLLGTPSSATLAVWVKPSGFPTTEGEVLSLGNYLALRVSATQVKGFYYTGATSILATATFTLPTTTWTHLAYTFTPGSQQLYINGTLAASTTNAAPLTWTGRATTTTLFGGNPDATTVRYQGSVDDARVYSRALSATDIAALVAVPPDFTSGMVMHLKFDEGAFTTAQDSTANDHDGALGAGVSWVPSAMGTHAVALNGTATGIVTVSGLLGTPASATLTALVNIAAFPTTQGDVLSLGNHLALRLSATAITGFYATSVSTWFSTTTSVAVPLSEWMHLAYTVTAGSQHLYLNGSLVASSNNAAPIVWTGLGSTTVLGGNAEGFTTTRYQGIIDDARVYSRVLSATDIAALAAFDDASVLTLQILSPTAGSGFSTSAAVLSTLSGTASDDVGVTSVTWNCPTCSPTLGTASCTPACGAATTATNWQALPLTLGLGANLITVTAHDIASTVSDSLTVTYTPPPVAGACTHWASQAGGGTGLSQGSPSTIAAWMARPPVPGNTLCLLDGTYTGVNSMILPPVGLSGTSTQPLTIQALNDGGALLDGQNARNPVSLDTSNDWWVIRGLNGRNGLTYVFRFLGSNNYGTRLVGWNGTSGQSNATIFTLSGTNSIIEDCGGWGTRARVIFQGSGTVNSPGSGYRRCWGEWNSHPGGGTLGGACAQPGVSQFIENLVCSANKTSE